MKKLISFCLWGDNPKYVIGAIKNADLLKEIYPGWKARFYCGQSVPEYAINRIKSVENCEVVMMGEPGDWTSMFWRFYPASEEDIDIMISRDVDSRLNMREKYAVDEWLESDKSFHIMRDHPWHKTLILGGMWGAKYPKLKDLKDQINNFVKGNYWQIDQNFLDFAVWPVIQGDVISHDEFFTEYGETKPFPTPRKNLEFVGETFDENDNPNMQHRGILSIGLKNKEIEEMKKKMI